MATPSRERAAHWAANALSGSPTGQGDLAAGPQRKQAYPGCGRALRRAPIEWETPTGKPAMVSLELQLSAFFGYGKAAEDAYLGLQCHGVLWPAVTAEAPIHWPIAPPIVSGKVHYATNKPASAYQRSM